MKRDIIIKVFLMLTFASLISCNGKKETDESEFTDGDIYSKLRQSAFHLKSSDIGLKSDTDRVLAGIMEFRTDSGTASLVMVADGSVSLYSSEGGSMIGAGDKFSVLSQAGEKVLTALRQSYQE